MSFYDLLQNEAITDKMHRIVVGGVVISNGKFVLLERERDAFMGEIFEIPSGKMEFGETIENCLVRQIKEELGCDINKVKRYLGHFDYLSNTGQKVRQFNFLVDLKENSDIIISKEHKKIEYFTMRECEFCNRISEELLFILNLANIDKSFKEMKRSFEQFKSIKEDCVYEY